MVLITACTVQQRSVALKIPFITSLGEKSVSRNLVVEIHLNSGVRGIGFINRTWWGEKELTHPTALGALECAVLDAEAQENHKRPTAFFGNNRKPIQTDITLSAWDADMTLKVARHYYRKTFRRFKVKIGKAPLRKDMNRLDRLITQFEDCEFWIDANQGLTTASALKLIRHLEPVKKKIRGLEQPTPKEDLAALKKVKDNSPFPVYADESAGSLENVKRLIKKNAVDGIVVKIAKTGLFEAMEIVRLARRHHKKTMISCMAESARGLATSVHWAIGDGGFDWVDLDSFELTRSSVPTSLYEARGPWLSLPRLRART